MMCKHPHEMRQIDHIYTKWFTHSPHIPKTVICTHNDAKLCNICKTMHKLPNACKMMEKLPMHAKQCKKLKENTCGD